MTDFYEIDFQSVHTSKSGDAIAIRYQIGANWWVHVVDGGYQSTGPELEAHIRRYYDATTHINNVVVTHPDQDHAEGLAHILEAFTVDALWMLRPWAYADELVRRFARYSSAEGLRRKLRSTYPYIVALEDIASQKGIPIYEPFQGASIGPFKVLAPSLDRYLQLVVDSDKTPQAVAAANPFAGLLDLAKLAVRLVKSGWGSEVFSDEETSAENEMSVIQYAELCGDKILLTADAGRSALTEAAIYAPSIGLMLPGIDRFQVPHHGGRRNVSTALLDHWLGPRLNQKLPQGSEKFIAIISSAKEDTDHPRKSVVRAMIHRGAKVITTEEETIAVWKNAPTRGWHGLSGEAYPDEQEE